MTSSAAAAEAGGVLTVCLNPTLQKTVVLEDLREGAVNRAVGNRTDASGKGVNVARALQHLGVSAASHLCQFPVGAAPAECPNAAAFARLAAAEGIACVYAATGNARDLRGCYTLLKHPPAGCGERSTTEIVEEGVPVGPSADAEVRRRFAETLPRCAVVVISGSKAPGFSPTLFGDLVEAAKAAGKTVICDYRGADLRDTLRPGRKHYPDIIKPNLAEFAETYCLEGDEASDLLGRSVRRLRALCDEFGVVGIITRGAMPTLVVQPGKGEPTWHPVKPIAPERIVNTTGCGDSFTAGLAAALARGSAIEAAVEEGHRAAGLNARTIIPGDLRLPAKY